jgi:hypothetical protein
MYRGVLTGLLSFFLLFMQQESVRHALEHIGAELQRSKHSVLERPTGDVCVECELLASGASSIPASSPTPFVDIPASVVIIAPVARTSVTVPSYYRSRAPPRILLLA